MKEIRDSRNPVVHVVVVVVAGSLVPLPPPEEGPIVKHVLSHWVQGPVVPLPRVPRLSRDLDETVVETQIVTNGILPSGELVSVVREPVHDEFTDTGECELLVGGLEDGHCDEGDVGVGGFDEGGGGGALLAPGGRAGASVREVGGGEEVRVFLGLG
jgi:hypothetical protein